MKVPRETNDPIVAIATPAGRGGVGVVRVSGADLTTLMESMAGKVPQPRCAEVALFHDAAGGLIDQGLLLWFPGPHSYTGEDVVELQAHGSPAVMAQLLTTCIELGCRVAKPGEFTERAFLAGKLDLAQAEGVADLIDAGSIAAAKSAARTLVGEFSKGVNRLAAALVEIRLHTEAHIDFPEEEIQPDQQNSLLTRLKAIRAELGELLHSAKQGAILRDGLTVALIGRPNVGKSSLLNRLAGEDLAIVTPIPGTTRDHVRATIILKGVPIHLIDTAGLRETDDPVEALGIGRTWEAVRRAGAALMIIESGTLAAQEEAEIVARLPVDLPMAWVYNKTDLFPPVVSRETNADRNHVQLMVSALTGEGVGAVCGWLLDVAGWQADSEGVFLARARHLDALRRAENQLEIAETVAGTPELFAEELRLAHRALGEITGEFSADDLLGEIFGRFCIGK